MDGHEDEPVYTLYASMSWPMTQRDLLSTQGKEDYSGSKSEDSNLYVNGNRNGDAALKCCESRWLYTSGPFKNGAVGLYNMGLTCCLNSLLQTLYMNREFTDILQGMDMPEDAAALQNNMPYQLLTLFEMMQSSRRYAVYPYQLLRCLQKHGMKLFVQQDAAELFMTLFNHIRDQLAKPQPNLAGRLSSLYTIHIQEYLTCLKCTQEKTRDSNLIALPLPLTDPRFKRPTSLEEALAIVFRSEKPTEENMWLCEDCGEKTASLQGMRVRSLPRTLTLHLKRLSSTKSSWVRKISRRISFPLNLDLSQILEADVVCCESREQEDWKYELFAVVAHSGTPICGHYCSYIRNMKDQRWYSFNDSSVSKVSWDDVKCTFGNANLHWSETAYLLVYQRTESH
ncbi:ubl carboxyl-terminal hydrolase 18 [Pleurodeles waltl]